MDRINEINNFLSHFEKLSENNPNLDIPVDTFYQALLNCEVIQETFKNCNIENYFTQWLNYFKNNENISVNYIKKEKCLQFSSSFNNEYSKLYISFAKEDIYEAVNKIFSFIAENKIPFFAKVNNTIKVNSIIIGLENIADTQKIINFINHDLFLNNKCKKPHPFLIANNNIGLVYDQNLDYNYVLAELLQNFFRQHQKRKEWEKINAYSFRDYIGRLYNKFFTDKEACHNNQIKDQYNQDRKKYGSFAKLILNYQHIFYLIYWALEPKTNDIKYFKCLQRFFNTTKNDELLTIYQKEIHKDFQEKDYYYEIALLKSYIRYIATWHGSKNVSKYLQIYIKDDNAKIITRNNNYRFLFTDYLPPSLILEITNYNLDAYINRQLLIFEKMITMFTNICTLTYLKYGLKKLAIAIENARENNFANFVDDNNQSISKLIILNGASQIDNFCHLIIKANSLNYDNGENLNYKCALAIEKSIKTKETTLKKVLTNKEQCN